MTCAACQRANLPGGVRCIYCGTHFPPAPGLDLDLPPAGAAAGGAAPPGAARRGPVGWLSGLLLLLFKGKWLLTLIKLPKILLTLSSMLVFIAAEAQLFGWKFAVGFAVSILIHELGHVFVNWRKGLKATAPMFIPFLGAVIFLKRFPNDPTIESESGAGGPAAGFLAALVCAGIGAVTGSPYWLALANIGFLINLFNLIPFPPLDGSHIAAVFSLGNWDFVLISLLLWAIKFPSNFYIWGILLVGFVFRLGRTGYDRYHLSPPFVRLRMTLVYLGLCLALSSGAAHTSRRGVFPPPSRKGTQVAYAQSPGAERAPADARPLSSDGPTVSPENATDNANARPFLRIIAAVVWIGALALSALGWLLVAYLVAIASGQRLGWLGWSLAGWMVGGFAALYGLTAALKLQTHGTLSLAYFAGLGAALVFSIYHASHARGKGSRRPRSWLTWRCMGWTAGAALVVAYWSESLWVAAAVLIGAALFYARRPALLPSFLAHLSEQYGSVERAIALHHRALAWSSDPEIVSSLWLAIARAQLVLQRGEAGLAAFDAAAAVPGAPQPAGLSALLVTSWRAGALIALDRFDEALAACERIVNASPGDRMGPWRLMFAHAVLSDLALYRRWPDEALAQAGCVLQSAPKIAGTLSRAFLSEAYRVRAEAQVAEGRLEEARAECQRALQWSRTPSMEVSAATIRARAALRAGDPAAAERETQSAVNRLPGSLAVRYWRGAALRAAGRRPEGDALLQDLAAHFPREHWGRLAATALAG